MYFDEDLMLEIRLNTLNEIVDKFVICEATRDHGGNKKKLNFVMKKFSKFKSKIEYLIVDDVPLEVKINKKNWHENHIRDQFQRNAIHRALKGANDDDWIMISDIDEIPDPKKIKEFNTINKYACFLQKNFQSKINFLNVTEDYWPGTKICQMRHFKSPQWLRNIKIKKKPFWKIFGDRQPQLIKNGGWHFSFLKKPELIIKKIKAYAHQEFNTPKFIEKNYIEEKISKGEDLFERNIKYKAIKIDESFPNYILNNKGKFKDWIA